MTTSTKHPVWIAIRPLLDAVGGVVVDADQLTTGDVPIVWDWREICGIRLESHDMALYRLVAQVDEEHGGTVVDLPPTEKQAAVRLLADRGAIVSRKSIEDLATLMGVRRITFYNYLNVIRND